MLKLLIVVVKKDNFGKCVNSRRKKNLIKKSWNWVLMVEVKILLGWSINNK